MNTADSLLALDPMLPKINKPSNTVRPVINSVDSCTSRISEFFDHHLEAEVKKLKSYVKDMTDFINRIIFENFINPIEQYQPPIKYETRFDVNIKFQKLFYHFS